MKATSFSSSISANLGNSGEAMVEIHKYIFGQAMKKRPTGHTNGLRKKFMAATLSYFNKRVRRKCQIVIVRCPHFRG